MPSILLFPKCLLMFLSYTDANPWLNTFFSSLLKGYTLSYKNYIFNIGHTVIVST